MTSQIDYLDFELTVERAEDNRYRVIATSGEKSAQSDFTNPFGETEVALIKMTTKANLRSSRKVRSASGGSEVKQLKAWGAQLFNHAIAGDVGKFYEECRTEAQLNGKGLRWRLALDSTTGDLPWEFLCTQEDFLALNPFSPVVRYVPRSARLTPLKESERPLQLLVVIASPKDEIPLDTAAEKERITRAFESLTTQGLVEVNFIEGRDTWQKLYDTLFKNETHILHFIGHGAFDPNKQEGVLVMEDAEGKSQLIESEGLRVLVQGRSRLRLVVLNSCLGTEGDNSQPFSSVAAGLIQSGVPAVIAMQAEISDDAAKEIAETFYKSLALNMPVDTALTEARRKIFLFDMGSLEWATPILYMQVPNGQLFQFKPRDTGALPALPEEGPETAVAIAVLTRSDTEQEIPLSRKTIRIGRLAGNDVVVNEDDVSRKHAVLTRTDSTYEIENLGGTGTSVNHKLITTRTELQHGDVIGVGSVQLTFKLLSEVARELTNLVPAKPPAVTASTSFEEQAARFYEQGEQFMAAGKWAEAMKAFNGARTYVPVYRDVPQKLAICENRLNVESLYSQAQQFCGTRNYDQSIAALDELARLDPKFVDTFNVRQYAKVGQKYAKAIAELQKGNREGGAAMLREVVSERADFEDASARLQNIADGGNGLTLAGTQVDEGYLAKGKQLAGIGKQWWNDMFGSAPAPRTPAVAPPSPKPSTISPDRNMQSRLYSLPDHNPQPLVEQVNEYFQKNGYTSQVIEREGVWLVQGQGTTGVGKYVGLGEPATVIIEVTRNKNTKVSVGCAKWLEKGGALLASAWIPYLMIPAYFGQKEQARLLDGLWQTVEAYMSANGARSAE